MIVSIGYFQAKADSASRPSHLLRRRSTLRVKFLFGARCLKSGRPGLQRPVQGLRHRRKSSLSALGTRSGNTSKCLGLQLPQQAAAARRQRSVLQTQAKSGLSSGGLLPLALALALSISDVSPASASSKQLTVDRELLEGLLLENAESRIHTLSDEELLRLFREVAGGKAPEVKEAAPRDNGFLSGLTKQLKAVKEAPAKEADPVPSLPIPGLSGSRGPAKEEASPPTSPPVSSPKEAAGQPASGGAPESDLTSSLLRSSGLELPAELKGDTPKSQASESTSSQEGDQAPRGSDGGRSAAQTPAEVFLGGLVALLNSQALVSGFSLAGLIGLTYIFFKYIAADDEEEGQGEASPAKPPPAPSTSGSTNGAAKPVEQEPEPQPQGLLGKAGLEPLKRFAEALPQLPNAVALLQQRLPFVGSKAGQNTAGGSSRQAEQSSRKQQAAASSTSTPQAPSVATEQAAAQWRPPFQPPTRPQAPPQPTSRRPEGASRPPEAGFRQPPPVLWQRSEAERSERTAQSSQRARGPGPSQAQGGVGVGAQPGVLWERRSPSQPLPQRGPASYPDLGAAQGRPTTAASPGPAREADFRPRYPPQQPPSVPLPEATPSLGPANGWGGQSREHREQAAEATLRPAPATSWAPPPQPQPGAAPPPVERVSGPEGQGWAAESGSESGAAVTPSGEGGRGDRLAQQAAVIRQHRGLQVSESDRMWHPHLAELLESQPGEVDGGAERSATANGSEGAVTAVVEAQAVETDSKSAVEGEGLKSNGSSEAPGVVSSSNRPTAEPETGSKGEVQQASTSGDSTPGISSGDRPLDWPERSSGSGAGQWGREGIMAGRGQASSSVQATMSDGSMSSDDEGYFPRQRHRDAFRQRQRRRRGLFQPSNFV